MDPSEIETLLNEDCLPKGRLPDGLDPWEPGAHDKHRVGSERWWLQVELGGHTATCENCGKTWPIHPSNVGKTFACSQACRDAMYHRRKKGENVRPATPLPWAPHLARKNA